MAALATLSSFSIEGIAVGTIILGAYRSLYFDVNRRQTLSSSDASRFPFTASLVLTGLFTALYLFGREVINEILRYFFVVTSVAAVYYLFRPLVRHWVPAAAIALAACGCYFVTRHWILNNVLAVGLAVSALEMMHLSSFKVGALLLTGLFFFDIFWVFGSVVMVDVATKIDGPIKIVVPLHLFNATVDETSQRRPMRLLGLGDIVIPGVFLAMLLHFDASRAAVAAVARRVNAAVDAAAPAAAATITPLYFGATIVMYVVAFTLTILIGMATGHGQPALLYLVPVCLITPLVIAAARRELPALVGFEFPDPAADATVTPLVWADLTPLGKVVDLLGFDASEFRKQKAD